MLKNTKGNLTNGERVYKRAGIGTARSKDLTNNILYIPGKRRQIIKALPSIKARLSPKLLDTALLSQHTRVPTPAMT